MTGDTTFTDDLSLQVNADGKVRRVLMARTTEVAFD